MKTEVTGIPEHLLTPPCEAVRHGDGSVKQLAAAYVHNLGCIRKMEVSFDSIRQYQDRIIKKEGAN